MFHQTTDEKYLTAINLLSKYPWQLAVNSESLHHHPLHYLHLKRCTRNHLIKLIHLCKSIAAKFHTQV